MSAKRRIGKRDPDDVDALALALTLKLPVWSNDNDFEESGVELVHDCRTAEDARNRVEVNRQGASVTVT